MQQPVQVKLLAGGIGTEVIDYGVAVPEPKLKMTPRGSAVHIKVVKNSGNSETESTPLLLSKKSSNFNSQGKGVSLQGRSSILEIPGASVNSPARISPPKSTLTENKFNFLAVAQQQKEAPKFLKSASKEFTSSDSAPGFLPKLEKQNSNLNISSTESFHSQSSKGSKETGDSRINDLLRSSQITTSFNYIKNSRQDEILEDLATGGAKSSSSFERTRLVTAVDWDQQYTPIYRRLGIDLAQKFHPTPTTEQVHPKRTVSDKESVHLGLTFLKNSLISSPRDVKQTPRKKNFRIVSLFSSREAQELRTVNDDISKFERNLETLPHHPMFAKVDLDTFKTFNKSASPKKSKIHQ